MTGGCSGHGERTGDPMLRAEIRALSKKMLSLGNAMALLKDISLLFEDPSYASTWDEVKKTGNKLGYVERKERVEAQFERETGIKKPDVVSATARPLMEYNEQLAHWLENKRIRERLFEMVKEEK